MTDDKTDSRRHAARCAGIAELDGWLYRLVYWAMCELLIGVVGRLARRSIDRWTDDDYAKLSYTEYEDNSSRNSQCTWRCQKYEFGGLATFPLSFFLSLILHTFFFFSLPASLHSFYRSIGPLNFSWVVWESAVSSPAGVWD